jgi:Tfp pilus assembly protein PilX
MEGVMSVLCRKDLRKGGFALATVLAGIFVSTLLVTGVVKYSMQRAYSASKMGDRAKAITYSEAGLDYAYSKISKDFELRNDVSAFPATTYGEGSYEIILSNSTNDYVLVSCVGYCGTASNVAAISVRNYTDNSGDSDLTDGSEAWGYAVFTGGSVSWTGSGTYAGATNVMVHSNQAIELSGSGEIGADVFSVSSISVSGNAHIYGNATATDGVSAQKTTSITGTSITDPVSKITFPEIEMTPYYDEAVANGQVSTSVPSWLTTGDGSPSGGIIWIEGDAKLNIKGTISACIIATGSIVSVGKGTIKNYESYPTLVSLTGDISISGQGDYEGLVYAKTGGFSMSGSGMISGQIVVAGEVSKSGNSDAFSFVNSAPIPPDSSDSADEDVIGISGWEK